MKERRYEIAIVGAGTGGIAVAARLIRANEKLKGQVVIIDPQTKHYYQPLWTLVGGGASKKEYSEREQASVIPEGVDWLQEAVATFIPEENKLMTDEGTTISYNILVVAAGIQLDWDRVKGLKEAVGHDGVCSNYSYDYVDSTWKFIQEFKGGTAIFTHPNTPIKCGGAPQKIMYLADDYFRKNGVRNKSNIIFASANANIFQVERYANTLDKVIERKGIHTKYYTDLVEIIPEKKQAVFENIQTKERETLHYDMIHVVPPMSSPDFIKRSPLADAGGWVDVDPYTLQHKKYSNVFGVGDCTNLPTSKTGAAIRKQAPVAAENILALLKQAPLTGAYDGYTSCPLVTGYNKLVLAEFDYNKEPEESFPFDQSKERVSMYIMKKHFLPLMYWNGMLKGLM